MADDQEETMTSVGPDAGAGGGSDTAEMAEVHTQGLAAESWYGFASPDEFPGYPSDIYDPNEIFDVPDESGTTLGQVHDPPRLIRMLLNLDRPELTMRMVDYLLEDGTQPGPRAGVATPPC